MREPRKPSSSHRQHRVLARYMRPEDLPGIMNIELRVFSSPWSREAFTDIMSLPSMYPYVCFLPDSNYPMDISGYCIFHDLHEYVHLINIARFPGRYYRGLGKILLTLPLRHALEEAIRFVMLEVRPSNQRAVALYHEFGFQVIGRRKHYYTDDGEDCLVMALFLVSPQQKESAWSLVRQYSQTLQVEVSNEVER
jgi:[ribosomal protein S18]-alanine N-acetyltransferase